jgi:histidine triad (HIT) family protein
MNSCIFCEIINRKYESSLVYEDDLSIGFMALEPVNPGHVLLMPKAHYEDVFVAPQEEISRLLPIANSIAYGLKKIFHPPKVGIVSASLVVQHAHWHITPIYSPTDITCRAELEGTLQAASRSELNTLAKCIREAMPHA